MVEPEPEEVQACLNEIKDKWGENREAARLLATARIYWPGAKITDIRPRSPATLSQSELDDLW
jgi:hypothetical protein